MTPNDRSLSHWQVAGHPFSLTCTDEAVEQLRRYTQSADQLHQVRGTLFGKWEGAALTVLTALEDGSVEIPKGALPAGWFQVRTEPDIHLTGEDLGYFDSHFPAPHAVALILRPAANQAIRAGVFFRESNGAVRSASSYQEVLIAGPVTAERIAPTLQPLKIGSASKPSRPWMGWALSFAAGLVAGVLSLAAIRGANPPAPVSRATAPAVMPVRTEVAPLVPAPAVDPTLVARTRQLQTELEAERAHSRLLETTLTILRQRLQSQASPRLNSFEKQAQTDHRSTSI